MSVRGALGLCCAIGLVASASAFTGTPTSATAQGTGTIEVHVQHDGAPVIETIRVDRDRETCGSEAKIEKVVVGANKGLANAVASVPSAKGQPAAGKPVVDQHGCSFVPHVTAMTPGDVDFRNSDDVLHDIHTHSSANPSVDKAQPKFMKVMTEKVEQPEIVQLTCDVHSWMLGWLVVVPTPYFGVTDGNGVTRIENVPAGQQTVEVWHETLGKQTKDVQVERGQIVKVSFAM